MMKLILLAFTLISVVHASEVKSNFLKVKDLRYHYLSQGDESRPMMLFLHGFPELSWAWKEQLKAFSKNYFAVALDLKGYNLSAKPDSIDEYAVSVVADEVSEFIKLMGHKKVILVGHDWGAAVAWTVAFRHSEVLSKLVIINGSHPILFFRDYHNTSCQYKASQYIRDIQSGLIDYSQDDFGELQSTLFNTPFFDQEVRERYLQSWRMPGGLQGGLKYYHAMKIPSSILFKVIPPHLNPIFAPYHLKTTPTLVLWGTRDIYACPHVNAGLEKFVKQLTLKTFDDHSHWIIHENPKLINSEIKTFVER